MRRSNLSAAEIEADELEADKRRTSRRDGFSMVPVRDRGWYRLANGTVMIWHVPSDKQVPGRPYPSVPDGSFMLITANGEHLMFNGEQFRRYLRWV